MVQHCNECDGGRQWRHSFTFSAWKETRVGRVGPSGSIRADPFVMANAAELSVRVLALQRKRCPTNGPRSNKLPTNSGKKVSFMFAAARYDESMALRGRSIAIQQGTNASVFDIIAMPAFSYGDCYRHGRQKASLASFLHRG